MKQFKRWQNGSIANCNWLMTIPGWHVYRVWFDAAHSLDLGWYQFICASCIIELVEEHVWAAGTRAERFKLAYADYKAWCQNLDLSPAPEFDEKKFHTEDKYAQLSQLMAKGAQTKHMVHWLHDVCMRPGVSNNFHGRARQALLRNIERYERIFSRNGRFINATDLSKLQQSVEDALVLYNHLKREACAPHNP